MFRIKSKGIFLIDCSIMMLTSLVCFSVIWGELGYVNKLHKFDSINTSKLLYLATITNKIVPDNAKVDISDSSLKVVFEETTYLLQFKNNNLYLYKNGSGTQILIHNINSVTFIKSSGLIMCLIIEQNSHHLEWGIINEE